MMKIKSVYKPASLEDAYQELLKSSKHVLMAGGAWLRLSNRTVEKAIDLGCLDLAFINDTAEAVEIGSMTTLKAVEDSEIVSGLYDGILPAAVSQIVGIGLRNVVTIGGNVVARHGFSDIITPLLAMNAQLKFYDKGLLSLHEYLETRGKTTDILEKIIIAKVPSRGYFKKVRKTALDFAVINVAVTKTEAGFNISVGSRPSVGMLCETAMALLNKASNIDENLVDKAAKCAADSLKFSDNHRGSGDYRRTLTEVYVKRGLLQLLDLEEKA